MPSDNGSIYSESAVFILDLIHYCEGPANEVTQFKTLKVEWSKLKKSS